jgi:hypothetical protein
MYRMLRQNKWLVAVNELQDFFVCGNAGPRQVGQSIQDNSTLTQNTESELSNDQGVRPAPSRD